MKHFTRQQKNCSDLQKLKDNGAKYAIATDVGYHRQGYFMSFSWNKLLRKKNKKRTDERYVPKRFFGSC